MAPAQATTPQPPQAATPVPGLQPTPVLASTPPPPTASPAPKVALALESSATVTGYWSDGSANVELNLSLRNEGNLRLDRPAEIHVACDRDGQSIPACREAMFLDLPNGYGPATGVLDLRIPTGQVSLFVSYGPQDGGFEVLDVDVPERIAGVDRDVWECFSDTSHVGSRLRDELGIGCGGWSSETALKWDRDNPVRVHATGRADWVPEFRLIFADLAEVLRLQLEWVDATARPNMTVYLGISPEQAGRLGFSCGEQAQGCAETVVHRGGMIDQATIIIFGKERGDGPDFHMFSDREKSIFRAVMTHEAIHALSRMSHRSEPASIMLGHGGVRAGMSPLDQALLQLYGNELIEPGMMLSEVESLVVFNDDLLDPQPAPPAHIGSRLISHAYEELRQAETASFRLRTTSPGCTTRSQWADYRVGNLLEFPSSFGWVEIGTASTHLYSLLSGGGRGEFWLRQGSNWNKVTESEVAASVPGWQGELVDPHIMLKNIIEHVDWEKADVFLSPDGLATLRFHLKLLSEEGAGPGNEVETVLVINRDTNEITEYRMNWHLENADCPGYTVEAVQGKYGVDFEFPREVVRGSDFLESCEAVPLGLLSGYSRSSGRWSRQCGDASGGGGYVREHRFSLDGWGLVRFELYSPDDIQMSLFREERSGDTKLDWDAEGYLKGGSGLPRGEGRLRWAHMPLPAGDYRLEAVSLDAVSPDNFTLTIIVQPTPRPPYRFKSISVSGGRTCGLLQDGTPLCWGSRGVDGDGSGIPDGKFKSISAGGHVCGLLQDGQPVCWDFESEVEHTCRPRGGAVYCTAVDQPPLGPYVAPRSGGTFATATVRIVGGYYDQTPPSGERLETIDVGWVHACGLRRDGTAVCWGSNQHGKASPPPGERFKSISSGEGHTCAVRLDGTAVCWGDKYGELTELDGGPYVSISTGSDTCALAEDGTTKCWGGKGLQHCLTIPGGEGTFECRSIASSGDVPLSPPVDEIFALMGTGGPHCALRSDGSPSCWTNYSPTGLVPTPAERLKAVSSSAHNACALRLDGTAVCWGRDRYGESSPPSGANLTQEGDAAAPQGLVSVSAGSFHTCALDGDGYASCWGPSWWSGRFSGQFLEMSGGWAHACGLRVDGSVLCQGSDLSGQSSPPEGERFVSTTSGNFYNCGLRDDGTVTCWGRNDRGQLSAPEGEVFTAISSGGSHTCGLRSDQTAVCWGASDFGRLAAPNQKFSSISSGGRHTCALTSGGTPVCWGLFHQGQTDPPEGEKFTSLSSGSRHTCGLRGDGSAVCWGLRISSPAGETFVSIGSGDRHSCGIRADGTAVCWGSDDHGQATPRR